MSNHYKYHHGVVFAGAVAVMSPGASIISYANNLMWHCTCSCQSTSTSSTSSQPLGATTISESRSCRISNWISDYDLVWSKTVQRFLIHKS